MAESLDDLDSVVNSLNIDQEKEQEEEQEQDEEDAKKLGFLTPCTTRTSSTILEEIEKDIVITGQAQMPVKKNAEEYNMCHKYRGKAVIFNHKNFAPEAGLSTRNGTDADRDNLAQTLKKLDFEVEIYDDLDYSKLMQKISELSTDDHTHRDCLLIAVFSHGIPNKIYTYDNMYSQNVLWDPFTAERCPSLAGKPKIFLIQACQGDQLDGGTVMHSRTFSSVDGFSETDSAPTRETYTIPNRADFLMVFSTVPGYYSWRNSSCGSWFVQSVCKVFKKYGHHKDLLSMLTAVSRNVALNFESNVPGSTLMDQKKQIPYITSTLIREVYFSPKDPLGECVGRIIIGEVGGVEPPVTRKGKKGGLELFSSLVRPTSKPVKK